MSKRIPLALLALTVVLFAAGLWHLLRLRFEAGDVYPPYSSLRSDPLGTMALYESLGALTGTYVSRDYSSANRLPEGGGTTYLHLAASRYQWEKVPAEVFKQVEDFAVAGGRLSITFYPQTIDGPSFLRNPDKPEENQKESEKKDASKKPSKKARKKHGPIEEDETFAPPVPLKERWGVELALDPLVQDATRENYEAVQVRNRTDLPLPDTLDWHSGLVFTNVDHRWQTIYARGTNAVVIERKFGSGSVVMVSDSYLLSNEALRKDRQPEFLAWLAGPARKVVFDEAHLGVVENAGLAVLMRKYRLHGLGLGLLLLAGLFIWKNSSAFVPPPPRESASPYIHGKEGGAGFVNLLRRNIAPGQVLTVCFDEWKKSLGKAGPHLAVKVQKAQAILENNGKSGAAPDPISGYREICQVLKTPGL